jgi:hypothetical protein
MRWGHSPEPLGRAAGSLDLGSRFPPGHVPGVSSSPQMEADQCVCRSCLVSRARDYQMSLKSQTPPGLASGGHRFDPGTLHLESCRFTSGRVAARAAAQRVHVQCNDRRRAPAAGLFRGHAADADSGAADPGVAAVAFGAVLRPKTSRTGSQLAVGEPVA